MDGEECRQVQIQAHRPQAPREWANRLLILTGTALRACSLAGVHDGPAGLTQERFRGAREPT